MGATIIDCEPDGEGVYRPVRSSSSIAGGIGKALEPVREFIEGMREIRTLEQEVRETIRGFGKRTRNPRPTTRRNPDPPSDDVVDAEER